MAKLDLNQLPKEWSYLIKGADMADWHTTLRNFRVPYFSLGGLKRNVHQQLHDAGFETEIYSRKVPFTGNETNATLFDHSEAFVLMYHDLLSGLDRQNPLAGGLFFISAEDNSRANRIVRCLSKIVPIQNPVKFYLGGR